MTARHFVSSDPAMQGGAMNEYLLSRGWTIAYTDMDGVRWRDSLFRLSTYFERSAVATQQMRDARDVSAARLKAEQP